MVHQNLCAQTETEKEIRKLSRNNGNLRNHFSRIRDTLPIFCFHPYCFYSHQHSLCLCVCVSVCRAVCLSVVLCVIVSVLKINDRIVPLALCAIFGEEHRVLNAH